MESMKIKYSKEADILLIELRDGTPKLEGQVFNLDVYEISKSKT